ncbi:iron dependent repressor, metal binding and dimerization domain protein [Clostridiaceae bacterium M8S5]|nr:iron dependent repressor, metal binding and dimerization domain protein [Clostridiaceae bacterium M8S5]
MLSPSLEDYLEEVYRMSITKKEIRVMDIARVLSVSKPSVVKGLRKLKENGYIDYKPYERIKIEQKGIALGKFLCERNKLLKSFIVIIGSESDAIKEAEAMEHYFTIETIKCIEKLVSFFEDNTRIYNLYKSYEYKSKLEVLSNEVEE